MELSVGLCTWGGLSSDYVKSYRLVTSEIIHQNIRNNTNNNNTNNVFK
jgi:hypothetical protein